MKEKERERTGARERKGGKSAPDVFVSMRDRVHYATVSFVYV